MLHIIVQYLSKLPRNSILDPHENFRIEFVASPFSKLSSWKTYLTGTGFCLVLSNLPSTFDTQLLQNSTTFVQVLSSLLTCLTSEKKKKTSYSIK